MNRALIQKHRGEFPTPAHYAAWYGCRELGIATRFFEWPDFEAGDVELHPEVLVVASIDVFRFAAWRLGVRSELEPLNVPEELKAFTGRRMWTADLGHIRDTFEAPLFIKPLGTTKLFPGHVLRRPRDLEYTAKLPRGTPLLVSEVVQFLGEWRYFVCQGEVLGGCWYHGAWSVVPDSSIVLAAVNAFSHSAPEGYSIDFGVTSTGATALIEVNDGYALGPCGLPPTKYVRLLQARWHELMAGIKGSAV